MTEVPKRVADRVKHEQWAERAIARATAPPGGEPEPENAAQAFTARMAEQRQQEEEHALRVSRAMHEDPHADVGEDDPLRTLYAAKRARRARLRRRLTR